jgi:hypothetical protein
VTLRGRCRDDMTPAVRGHLHDRRRSHSTTLNAALNNNSAPPTTENATTCSATFVVTDPVTVVKGTKAYAGITVTLSFAELGPKNKNGTCNQSNNAQPVATYGSASATGTVSYG